MLDPVEYKLVVKALQEGLNGCVEWRDDRVIRTILSDREMQGWTPAGIKLELIEFVRGGGCVEQVVEKRPEWKGEYRFYYKAILPIDGFPHGVFVEIVLEDSDPDLPSVLLVSSHPQRRS